MHTQTQPLLTATQEHDLALRVRSGDRAARDQFILANTRLALAIAHRYSHGIPDEDLEQEACIGLIRAVDHFDPSRGVRFSTFAYPLIQHAITNALRRSGRSVPAISLSTPVQAGDEEDLTLEDVIADPAQDTEASALSSLFAGELRDLIEVALTPRERRVISLRYGLEAESVPLGQHEVAPLVHLSRSRVQQVERQALHKLKAAYLAQDRRIPGLRQLLLDLEAAA